MGEEEVLAAIAMVGVWMLDVVGGGRKIVSQILITFTVVYCH